MTFDLQSAIETQQQLVTSLQTKAANGIEGATAELQSAIAGLRDLQAMASKPKTVGVMPANTQRPEQSANYLIR